MYVTTYSYRKLTVNLKSTESHIASSSDHNAVTYVLYALTILFGFLVILYMVALYSPINRTLCSYTKQIL